MEKGIESGLGTVKLGPYGMALPGPGVYHAEAVVEGMRREIEVSIRSDGTLLWPILDYVQYVEPEFLVFGARIA
jgi:hypothetical protein